MTDTPIPILPPQEAIAFFVRKGLARSFAWEDIWTSQHDYYFTVAKMMQVSLLEEVFDLIGAAMKDGRSPKQLAADLKGLLRERGWWGRQPQADPLTGETRPVQLGSNRRVRTIVDVNLRASYGAGRYARQDRVKEALPILVYKCRMDGRERPQHHAWHNTALYFDDPWWKTHYGPCGWGCRCRTVSMTERMAARRGLNVGGKPAYFGTRKWVNRRTGEIVEIEKGIDAGWNYHPGRAQIEGLAPDPLFGFSAGDDRATAAAADAPAAAGFLGRFGLGAEGGVWRDATGWPLALSARWLMGLAASSRASAAQLAGAIVAPDRIALVWVIGKDGRAMLMRRYLLAVEGGGIVADIGNAVWRIARVDRAALVRLQATGTAIWSRDGMAEASYNARQPRDRNGRWIGTGGGLRANMGNLLAGRGKQVMIGEVSSSTARLIGRIGLAAEGKLIALDPSYSRHILLQHGGKTREALRGQKPVTKTDLANAARHINASRDIRPAESVGIAGHPRFVARSDTARSQITIISEVRKRRVVIVSMWKKGK